MGWVDSLNGGRVALDTAPVIYYIERNHIYREILHPFFQLVDRGECAVVTSVITLLEGLVVPIRKGDKELIRQYYNFLFKTNNVDTIPLAPNIAEAAAYLRVSHKLATPDSIQMATAIVGNTTFFLTNDKRLPSLHNLKTLMLDDLLKEPKNQQQEESSQAESSQEESS